MVCYAHEVRADERGGPGRQPVMVEVVEAASMP